MKHRLSEKWIKASIAGTIWAASEIVLGSFLHNLRVPFSGNILTGIGIIILISISYIWQQKGLFWRAGLVCAILKTMSPSAIIFGPMLAIFMESILLEASVMLLGRTIAGYIMGAMLAMSWNLFQKIINLIIFYGSGIVEIYSGLLKMAQRQLNIETDIVWLPVIILLIAYSFFGILAAIVGIRTGRRMLREPEQEIEMKHGGMNTGFKKFPQSKFDYSVKWLLYNSIALIASFLIISFTNWYIWGPVILLFIIVWAIRYKRALRQLSKPGFWIFFVVITLLTAFVFADTSGGESLFEAGLLTGIQMNFRAVAMIVGFSVIGTELYNPVVRNFFQRTSFKNLPLAIELSVESLPDFIASIPDFKSVIKDPVSIFQKVLNHAEKRLTEIRERDLPAPVIIVSGGVEEGKTTLAKNLHDTLQEKGIESDGIITERIVEDNITTGYDLIHLKSRRRICFLRQNIECGSEKIGRFFICPEGLEGGQELLKQIAAKEDILVIIDEVGLLELEGGGWTEYVTKILNDRKSRLLMTVRTTFLEDIKAKWNLNYYEVFNVNATDDFNITAILSLLQNHDEKVSYLRRML